MPGFFNSCKKATYHSNNQLQQLKKHGFFPQFEDSSEQGLEQGYILSGG